MIILRKMKMNIQKNNDGDDDASKMKEYKN